MRSLRHILLSLALFSAFTGSSQTFTAGGGSIPDNGPQVAFPIVVSGLFPTNINSTFGLETVCININHTYDGDLIIKLRAPDGTTVSLASNNGGNGANFTNTCFDPTASLSIIQGNAPFTGSFKPVGMLGAVNNGQVGNGTWQLLVQDNAAQDVGSVLNFSLTFGTDPAIPTYHSGNLPIVIINTNGNNIVNEPKVMARMGVIDNGIGNINHANDPWNDYNGWIGIEYRGSTSQNFAQKSYSIETRDSFGTEVNSSLLGMPSEHNWALVSTYNDKSLMRNALTYELCNRMGYYAPRTKFCELILDGQYQGVYILVEKIKRDANRVNIAKLEPQDISGDALTGGYILKIDKTSGNQSDSWQSNYFADSGTGTQPIIIQYEYPKQQDIQPQQKTYIRNYIDSFENALAGPNFAHPTLGYKRYADMMSFINNFIINEISNNVDGYRLSYYMYKDRNSVGGKLKSGPAWDYNLAWWNANYCGGDRDTGWAYRFGKVCPNDGFQVPFWWGRMLQDTNYTNALKCRWTDLRATVLSNQQIFAYIDSTATYLDSAKTRHFTQWPVMGTYVWPNPSPLANNYAEEITHLKDWITDRMQWLDANIPGTCWPFPTAVSNTTAGAENIMVYPNPFSSSLNINLFAPEAGEVQVELFSSIGQKVQGSVFHCLQGKNKITLNTGTSLPQGIYLLKISGSGLYYSHRMIHTAE